MKMISIKYFIESLGLIDGIKYWFDWNFIYPLKVFIWLNITHKSYCLNSGWFCKNENCTNKHLLTKKEILAHWNDIDKESKKIICGENDECAYCGIDKGEILIENPNLNSLSRWKVCKECKEIIEIQKELAFLCLIKNKNKDLQEKIFMLNNRLLEIKKISKKDIETINLEIDEDGEINEI
jgi:hypothetical protein